MRCYDKSTKFPSKSSIWISVWRPIHMKFQQPLDDHPSPILLNNQHNDSSVRHISYPKLSMMSTAWNPNVLHLDITYSMTLKSYLIKPSFPLDKNFELSMENEYSTIFSHFRSIKYFPGKFSQFVYDVNIWSISFIWTYFVKINSVQGMKLILSEFNHNFLKNTEIEILP